MSEIDRRALLGIVGVAGAGLALAGCTTDTKGDAVQGGDPGNDSDPAGGCEVYGEELSVGGSSVQNASFAPDHVCGVYIKYVNGKPLIRHAYADLQGGHTDAIVTRVAIPLLQALRDYPRIPYPTMVKWPRYNFDNFSLGSQQVLVIIVDNKPDDVRFNEDIARERIIRFTPFSGRPTNDPSNPYPKRELNHAFYNLQPFSLSGGGFEAGAAAYRLDFWNLDETGVPMDSTHNNKPDRNNPDTWKIYSMNIHLLQGVAVPESGITHVPTILDPDTGNMGSNP